MLYCLLGSVISQNSDLTQIRGGGRLIPQIEQRAGNIKVYENIAQPSNGDSTYLQYRVAIPTTQPNSLPGLNVLLHGDGGQSFFQFPNAKFENNLIGVAVLAPNQPMKWGGLTNDRTDGPQHATLVKDLITNVLPNMMQFDASRVYFTGVSGGSLTLSSAMLPLYGNMFPSGMLLLCGGLPKPIPANSISANTRIHFQSTTNELAFLKKTIPPTIAQVQQAVQGLQLDPDTVNNQFTVDASPQGGHCAFDGNSFNSGIQLMVNEFGPIMLGQPKTRNTPKFQPLSAGQTLYQGT